MLEKADIHEFPCATEMTLGPAIMCQYMPSSYIVLHLLLLMKLNNSSFSLKFIVFQCGKEFSSYGIKMESTATL